MALSRPLKAGKIVERFLFLYGSLLPPGDRWCDVIGLVPAGSVSSSSTLQIFRDVAPKYLAVVSVCGVRQCWLIFIVLISQSAGVYFRVIGRGATLPVQ